MAMNLHLVGYLVICLAVVSAAHDITSILMRHIERIDGKIENMEVKHRKEIQDLEDKLQQQERDTNFKIAELEQRLIRVEETNKALRKENDGLRTNLQDNGSKKLEMDTQRHDDSDNSSDGDFGVTSEKTPYGSIKSGNDEPKLQPTEIARPRKALQDGYNVAFSAYMDHDADGMGPGQTLIYNQILLNDGNGYNKHSGIFTVPVPGVYFFSFIIGERSVNQEWVALWVNSENKVDAAVEGVHDLQDLQGGNTVILKLETGDIVFVKSLYGGHVEGSNGGRLTTFSGFLLYPVETSAIVGK